MKKNNQKMLILIAFKVILRSAPLDSILYMYTLFIALFCHFETSVNYERHKEDKIILQIYNLHSMFNVHCSWENHKFTFEIVMELM